MRFFCSLIVYRSIAFLSAMFGLLFLMLRLSSPHAAVANRGLSRSTIHCGHDHASIPSPPAHSQHTSCTCMVAVAVIRFTSPRETSSGSARTALQKIRRPCQMSRCPCRPAPVVHSLPPSSRSGKGLLQLQWPILGPLFFIQSHHMFNLDQEARNFSNYFRSFFLVLRRLRFAFCVSIRFAFCLRRGSRFGRCLESNYWMLL